MLRFNITTFGHSLRQAVQHARGPRRGGELAQPAHILPGYTFQLLLPAGTGLCFRLKICCCCSDCPQYSCMAEPGFVTIQ